MCAEQHKLSMDILENLSKVPRFQTIAMFLDKKEVSGNAWVWLSIWCTCAYLGMWLSMWCVFACRAVPGVCCHGTSCRSSHSAEAQEAVWSENMTSSSELVVHRICLVACVCVEYTINVFWCVNPLPQEEKQC